jgi:hypothetical protein
MKFNDLLREPARQRWLAALAITGAAALVHGCYAPPFAATMSTTIKMA